MQRVPRKVQPCGAKAPLQELRLRVLRVRSSCSCCGGALVLALTDSCSQKMHDQEARDSGAFFFPARARVQQLLRCAQQPERAEAEEPAVVAVRNAQRVLETQRPFRPAIELPVIM